MIDFEQREKTSTLDKFRNIFGVSFIALLKILIMVNMKSMRFNCNANT